MSEELIGAVLRLMDKRDEALCEVKRVKDLYDQLGEEYNARTERLNKAAERIRRLEEENAKLMGERDECAKDCDTAVESNRQLRELLLDLANAASFALKANGSKYHKGATRLRSTINSALKALGRTEFLLAE